MAGSTTEAPVLPAIAAGEADAVQDCLRRYGGLVWSIARRMSGSTDDAEDAVQQVFIEVWKSAGRFDPERGSEATFIATIARRQLIDRLRRSQRHVDTVPIEPGAGFSGDDHERIERDADAAAAARELRNLKPDQRRAVELSVYQGMSHGEISEALSLPIGTVKSHIRRGLASVRDRLTRARSVGARAGDGEGAR